MSKTSSLALNPLLLPLFLLTYSFPKTVETVPVEATTFFFCFPPLKPPTTTPSPQFRSASSFDPKSIPEEEEEEVPPPLLPPLHEEEQQENESSDNPFLRISEALSRSHPAMSYAIEASLIEDKEKASTNASKTLFFLSSSPSTTPSAPFLSSPFFGGFGLFFFLGLFISEQDETDLGPAEGTEFQTKTGSNIRWEGERRDFGEGMVDGCRRRNGMAESHSL